MTLYSRTYGGGPDLVLLHGWASNSDIWQEIIPLISGDFRITVIDLPGFGRSPSLPNYDINHVVDAVLAVAPEQAHWLGSSLGGVLATAIAIQFPQRVSKLINVTSSPCFVAESEWPGIPPEKFRAFKQKFKRHPSATIEDFFHRLLSTEHQDDKWYTKLQAVLYAHGTPNVAAFSKALNLLETDLRSQLKHIKVPVLYLLGESDNLVPSTLAPALKNRAPDFFVEMMQHAGHFLFLTHTQEFLRIIKKFLCTLRP
jgi:pimeloyl-[acyl-carrier protein] methyl ester esterase